jgi:hypothetical protein
LIEIAAKLNPERAAIGQRRIGSPFDRIGVLVWAS